MKRVVYSLCIGSLALALTAGGAQAPTEKRPERAKPQHQSANVQRARPANIDRTTTAHRDVSAAQYRQQRSYAQPRTSSGFNRVARPASATPATVRERNLASNERTRERNSCEFRSRILSLLARFRSRTVAVIADAGRAARLDAELARGCAYDRC